MKLLLRNATVIDPASPHHRKQVDLFIEDSTIQAIAPKVDLKADRAHDLGGAMVSPGWIDIWAQVGDPGFEHREDLRSAAAAAMAGGFTGIGCLPNTQPVVDSKAGVHYLIQASGDSLVDFFPVAAISMDCRGKDITEMIDMHAAGAVAFSDGDKPIQDGGLMMRALLYTTAFKGVILNAALDRAVAMDGQMHEGQTSTSLGLRGIPGLSEALMVQRDLSLLRYTGGRLHIANLSTADGVNAVRQAKAEGLDVSCSVAALSLLYADTELSSFDSKLKVLPPLREESDRLALIQGLADGTIDIISGNHVPVEEERKKLEFPFAAFGATGLQEAFSIARTATREQVDLDTLCACLTRGPRRLFGLADLRIAEGSPANLTIFDPDRNWTPATENLLSRSKNSPVIGKELLGKPLGVINKGLVEILAD